MPIKNYPLSIAPMMDRTHRPFRFFMRLITKKTLLYTEMIPADAICYGDRDRLISFHESEHPIVLQIGGSKLNLLKEAAKIVEDYGYDEINLNVGCPSDRVQEGKFGVCLMKEPDLVAELMDGMQQSVDIPVTIKHRIGVDDLDDYDSLAKFVKTIADTGCLRFSVHARKAILKGLSPKDNRTIPPLNYEFVYQLKKDFPELTIEINGGISTLKEAQEHLKFVDSVMLGRAAWDNPFLFAEADSLIFDVDSINSSREQIIEEYCDYIEDQLIHSRCPFSLLLQPLFNIYTGQKGAAKWRRFLSENGFKNKTNTNVVKDAIQMMQDYLNTISD
ncbi:MAG: tRNA dihydrouridine(20/20a) synthase DusA [Planctomycetota bacterium]|nr:MAG: tRNA dihydrouridine(20/20a) synthase DusA [Planctomycetota bacterium]